MRILRSAKKLEGHLRKPAIIRCLRGAGGQGKSCLSTSERALNKEDSADEITSSCQMLYMSNHQAAIL